MKIRRFSTYMDAVLWAHDANDQRPCIGACDERPCIRHESFAAIRLGGRLWRRQQRRAGR